MMSKLVRSGKSGKVSYTLKRSKPGQATFSDVILPDGKIIRRVDEAVHRRALSNVSRTYKEKA